MPLRLFLSGLALTVGCLSLPAIAAPLPSCVAQAGAEFRVPEFVFEAMALNEMDQERKQTGMSRVFGPMALSQKMLKEGSLGIIADPSVVAGNACTNYRAAAWWLMNRAVRLDDRDIWSGVTRFYYGGADRDRAPMTNRVRDIFEVISLPPTSEMLALQSINNPQYALGRCIAKAGALAEKETAEDGLAMEGALSVEFRSDSANTLGCKATFRTVSDSGAEGETAPYSAQVKE